MATTITIDEDEMETDPLADPGDTTTGVKEQEKDMETSKTTSPGRGVKRPASSERVISGDIDQPSKTVMKGNPILPLFHNKAPVDQTSVEGKFSWLQVSERGYIPTISRLDPEKNLLFSYVSVKMVEKVFLSYFIKNLPGEVMSGICRIPSHKVTEAEARLLHEVNLRHCDNSYGRNETFVRDRLVKSQDFVRFYEFLNMCNDKIVLKRSNEHQQIGFLRINGECDVPYVIIKGMQYMPLFYFQGETKGLKPPRKFIQAWDWYKLKLCCKLQGLRDEMMPEETCPVVALEDLRDYFAPGATFMEYWPSADFLNKILSKKATQSGGWTRLSLNHGSKYRGKLSQLTDFPVAAAAIGPSYRAEKALVEGKMVLGVNMRPHMWNEVLVTLPSLVEQLFPDFSEKQIADCLLSAGALLYNGNMGHTEIIRNLG